MSGPFRGQGPPTHLFLRIREGNHTGYSRERYSRIYALRERFISETARALMAAGRDPIRAVAEATWMAGACGLSHDWVWQAGWSPDREYQVAPDLPAEKGPPA